MSNSDERHSEIVNNVLHDLFLCEKEFGDIHCIVETESGERSEPIHSFSDALEYTLESLGGELFAYHGEQLVYSVVLKAQED